MNEEKLEELFYAAVKIIQALPKEGPIDIGIYRKLKFYKYYKVATVGQNNTIKPSFFKLEDRLKWNAWESEKCTRYQAMYNYLKEFGITLKDIFTSGKTNEYLQNADLSFVNNLSISDINLLIEEAYKEVDTNIPKQIKDEMLNFFYEKLLPKTNE